MDKLLLGMPSLLELGTIEDNVRLCVELGLNFIELNMNLPQFQLDRIDAERLLNLKRNNNIFFTFHLSEETDIANFNSKIRNAYKETIKEVIELSKLAGCPIINMHMNTGTYFTLPEGKSYLNEKYNAEFNNYILDFSTSVDEYIGDSKVKILIENTGIYKLNFIGKAVDVLLKSDNFLLTLDVGHDLSSGLTDSSFIMERKHKLKHLHLHDGIGKINHLPLFAGEINILQKLALARETNSTCVIETKTIEALKYSILELNRRNIF